MEEDMSTKQIKAVNLFVLPVFALIFVMHAYQISKKHNWSLFPRTILIALLVSVGCKLLSFNV